MDCFGRQKPCTIPKTFEFMPMCVVDMKNRNICERNKAFDRCVNKTFDLIVGDRIGKYLRIQDKSYDVYTYNIHDTKLLLVFHEVTEYVDTMEQINTLINALLPVHIIDALRTNNLQNISRDHKGATVCFIDIKGFTPMCKRAPPDAVMHYLNGLFGEFNKLAKTHGVVKYEIIGDCYVAVAGVLTYQDDGTSTLAETNDEVNHADNMIRFASDVIVTANRYAMPYSNGANTQVRVGVHTGNVVSGVIGTIRPQFHLFGDTMNIASRMEATATPMCLHISTQSTRLYHLACAKALKVALQTSKA